MDSGDKSYVIHAAMSPNMLKRATTKRNKLEIKEDAAAHYTRDQETGSDLSG